MTPGRWVRSVRVTQETLPRRSHSSGVSRLGVDHPGRKEEDKVQRQKVQPEEIHGDHTHLGESGEMGTETGTDQSVVSGTSLESEAGRTRGREFSDGEFPGPEKMRLYPRAREKGRDGF